MEIVNIRIDERLIHGQVAAVWTRTLGATRIMVIDNTAVKSDIQKSALKMACPQSCKLSVLSVRKASENLKNRKYEGEKVFIVVKSPETLKELYDSGYEFSKVTVGNMAKKDGAVPVKDTVYVTEQNVQDFKYLADKGILFHACMVPSDPAIDFITLL
ncbi:PTS sugar transporter subunit IIB [Clostridium boliviensis]|uniref:PTS sugar transporter subunit IIB n=1 Tax=Clostridium boliviensis TaxID=318465 RepID=A0ABU4GG47_9CLOT|nr:PTS sugar transporter subunit IIB [Clostridium boliviensis]MDW2796604.1 PTS sugar transporter subunit IIB [Clostridium boliviensis]